jgi:hypothetical protein
MQSEFEDKLCSEFEGLDSSCHVWIYILCYQIYKQHFTEREKDSG